PDKTARMPDKAARLPDKAVRLPDKAARLPDGTARMRHRTARLPDETAQMPDASARRPDSTLGQGDGSRGDGDAGGAGVDDEPSLLVDAACDAAQAVDVDGVPRECVAGCELGTERGEAHLVESRERVAEIGEQRGRDGGALDASRAEEAQR